MPANAALKWSDYEEGADRATQVYTVVGATSASDAISTVGITVNTPFSGRPLLKAEEPVARTPSGPLYYEVWVRYSVPSGGGDHGTPATDPLLEPATVEWRPVITSEPVDRDIEGNAIIMPSGEPLNPPPTRDWTTWEINIYRNEQFFDFVKYEKFQNVINANAVTARQPNDQIVTFPAGTLMCRTIAPSEPYKVTATYVRMGFHLVYRRYLPWLTSAQKSAATSPFHIWTLSQQTLGYYGTSSTQIGLIVTPGGDQPPKPVMTGSTATPLDSTLKIKAGEGDYRTPVTRAAPTGVTAITGPAGANSMTPRYLVWKNYDAIDFAELNL